jgi:hypothetical protein
MASVFNLKTDASQLALGNEGLSKMAYDQLAPTRDITTTNFPNGEINFKFEVGGGKWFIPQRSYIRLRAQISKGDDASLLESDNVAPAPNMMSNLFQSAEFKINGKTISRVSDFMAQVSTLKYRLDKSSSWLDSVGNTTNFWDSFSARKSDVSADGVYNDEDILTSWANLGFDIATTTIAYTHADGRLAFARAGGGVVPDVGLSFPVGSRIRLATAFGGAVADGEVVVSGHVDGNTITVTGMNTDAGATNVQLTRVSGGGVSSRLNARRVSNVEIIWTPPLSIFDIEGGIPGSASCELTLTPQSSNTYQLVAFESKGATTKATGAGADNVKFSVENMYFYTNIINGPRISNSTYLLDLEQISCQASVVNNASFAQHSFHVSPSTYALTLAIQDGRAGSDTRASASRFKSYNNNFTASEETKLNRLYVAYAGQNYPSPDAEPDYVEGTGTAGNLSKDYTINRYIDSNIYSGSFFGTGGCESLEQYHDRGMYHYFATPRDADDASTRVVVNAGFQNGADVANMRILLLAHSRQVARIEMIDGRIQSVAVEDA